MTKDRVVSARRHINHELFNKKEEINALKKELALLNNINHIHNLLESRFKHFKFDSLKGLPHPDTLLNNIESSFLVVEKILLNEKIVIAGDYDADGICATCLTLDFFEHIGYTNVAYAMPNRFKHGYGFSPLLFNEIMELHPDTRLIITVDNGVSSFEAGAMCVERGIDLIITDHHTLESINGIERIPPCNFLVNPQQSMYTFEYPDICGSLVAWYLCCAIKITLKSIAKDTSIFMEYLKDSNKIQNLDSKEIHKIAKNYAKKFHNFNMNEFLLLVGIAIISDVMPLNAINHTICKYALKNLHRSKKIAIQTLVSHLSHKIDSQTLGFRLIPLLNAAGRIEDGKIALNFLRSKDEKEAQDYFRTLKILNDKRRALQDEVTYKAFDSLSRFNQSKHIIFAVGDDWHEGVLGIVAGKMTSDFKKPCFVLTHTNGICKGSARSFGDIDLISSMQRLAHLTNRHGGHTGAVGLEIPYANIQVFIDSFEPILCDEMETKSHILGILHPEVISHDLLATIDIFEPYGNGNPVPKFFLELEILGYKRTTKGFLEFALRFESSVIKAMFFNSQYATFTFNSGDLLQFSATPMLDSQNYQNSQIMLIIDRIYGLLRYETR
ncbi:single-stranded DNA exonuclease RecJ [Helicobacter saguini]|uniref:Single-stranded-DNA-specific exonuclease RecJ n=1 Tax=Helicobacter saguini TaxID=1548018 RepID=A0A347VKH4_9HELI|nr:DHH family phosphoesterase [Helicobacter saguini]MWV61141.1 single-stranded DNA exonuclease RecJ [Helicobacter saguini]MWV68190.1 single-stranded DNA exonuclease RecJ [Helicobacter saguini]MWV70346.1 single-stranded DNA exonuclease RecJ [Helicobacter saguini]MWV72248.1 single-stranded DNA exonuclease RecJ [Helicobacter saguini]TLD95293.1 single-stranded DNA exonuclease RecJ [Helicobacter saguini]